MALFADALVGADCVKAIFVFFENESTSSSLPTCQREHAGALSIQFERRLPQFVLSFLSLSMLCLCVGGQVAGPLVNKRHQIVLCSTKPHASTFTLCARPDRDGQDTEHNIQTVVFLEYQKSFDFSPLVCRTWILRLSIHFLLCYSCAPSVNVCERVRVCGTGQIVCSCTLAMELLGQVRHHTLTSFELFFHLNQDFRFATTCFSS